MSERDPRERRAARKDGRLVKFSAEVMNAGLEARVIELGGYTKAVNQDLARYY